MLQDLEGHVTKSIPHTAEKLILPGKLTLDERLLVQRAGLLFLLANLFFPLGTL